MSNARIIAAAPELFAACQGALECYENDCFDESMARELRDVIAKAKGRA